ncbi:LOW QUALITY PROTEIN: hypothetical protein PanWU01x14_368490 [Parasponia andersonii]|uniref:Uncharacterized protein n=1 Tax=Parasponia andersonii TaxID=3476 RepID=A0A2P5A516_PARAD|nr:LOW QUALITY PROTEIN: hypothetical protein PanWU01x14_368490 [Parasponia andersonii]
MPSLDIQLVFSCPISLVIMSSRERLTFLLKPIVLRIDIAAYSLPPQPFAPIATSFSV